MAKKQKENAVVIENVGPIERIEIPLPEAGVVVLKGHNGSGKSTAIQTVESLLGSSTNGIKVKDGEVSGTAEGFGVQIRFNRSRNTKSGELVAEGIDHRLNLAEFIDPGLKDPAAADAKRIKALASLSGLKADATLFHDLFGGAEEFQKHVFTVDTAGRDIVELAAVVKRRLEASARNFENDAERLTGERDATSGAIVDVEDSGKDLATLEQERSKAEIDHAVLLQTKESATAAEKRRQQAAKRVEEIGKGANIERLKNELKSEIWAKAEATQAILSLQKRLDEQQKLLTNHENNIKATQSMIEQAEKVEAEKAALLETINAGQTAIPTDAEIVEAAQRADAARRAVLDGVKARDNAHRLQEVEKLNARIVIAQTNAGHARDAAGQVDDVVSQAIKVPGLSVENGRLVTKHKRGKVYFGELSHGERTRIALELGVRRVGKGGLLVLPQEFWEGLDGDGRAFVDQSARELGVRVLTAQASESVGREPIHAEVFETVKGGN